MSYAKPSDEHRKTGHASAPPRAGRPRRRLRRAVATAAAMAGAALLAAACGGGTAPPAAQGGSNSTDNAAAYTRCMRANGVADFPEPSTEGKPFGAQSLHQAGVDPASPPFQSATKACAHLFPAEAAAGRQQLVRLMLRYAACMRAHGVPNFPDPSTAGGGVSLPLTQSISGSPRFQPAQQACRPVAPGLAAGSAPSKSKAP